MPWVPTVRQVANGGPVEAGYTNQTAADLIARTDYLKSQLDAVTAGSQLIIRNQLVSPGLVPGTPVYYDAATSTFKASVANIAASVTDIYAADNRTYWQGIIKAVSGTSADIVIGGSLTLLAAQWNTVFVGGTAVPGDVFLSEEETNIGKITNSAGTLGVYIGHLKANGELLIRLGAFGAYLNHIHVQRTLLGQPAGTVVDPGSPNPQIINVPNPALQGWLPATNVYFPGFVVGSQIPTGAKFGYNIQHASETALRQIFPVTPPENAQFNREGLILDDTKVVINNYGIWWMDNSYGNAPWAPTWPAPAAPDILLWTTRMVAQASLLELIKNSIYADLVTNIGTIAVSKLLPYSSADLSISGTGNDIDGYTGPVTLRNKGVTALRPGRGLNVTASSLGGTLTAGYKGLTDLETNIELEAKFLYNAKTAGSTMLPITTNGVPSGADIALYGHALGGNSADHIDFVLKCGDDLAAAPQTYQPVIRISGCVDTVVGAPTYGTVAVEIYVIPTAGAVSTTNQKLITVASFQSGTPGVLQQPTLGPLAPAAVQQGNLLVIRLKNSLAGGIPIDTLRVLSVVVGLVKV